MSILAVPSICPHIEPEASRTRMVLADAGGSPAVDAVAPMASGKNRTIAAMARHSLTRDPLKLSSCHHARFVPPREPAWAAARPFLPGASRGVLYRQPLTAGSWRFPQG